MKRFHWPAFVSVFLLLVFCLLTFSGVLLYVAPEGSLSRWIDWHILGLDKKQWEALHTIMSAIFILGCVMHILWINWALLKKYFRKSPKSSIPKEMLSALGLIVVLFFLSVGTFRPLSYIYESGEKVSGSWEDQVVQPDLDDPARQSFFAIVRYLNPDSVKDSVLKEALVFRFGVHDKEMPFAAVAEAQSCSPEELYILLKEYLREWNITERLKEE